MRTPSVTWTSEIDAWALALRAAGYPATTVYLRAYHLRRLAGWAGVRDPWDLTLDDLLTWTGGHDWARETRRSCRSSLRGFWGWGVLTERTGVNVALGLPVIAPAQPKPRPAPPAAVEVALQDAPRRVWLMLRLANELGMRRGEVARVHSDDVTRDLLGWSLHVHGKGSRDRLVALPDTLARAIAEEPAGYLFPGQDHGHLSARWVGTLVSRTLPVGVSMHALRHLCATELHDATHDLRAIQQLLGHASVATTERYIAVLPDTVRRMVTDRSKRWAA
jgi:integrase/recombinase XerC